MGRLLIVLALLAILPLLGVACAPKAAPPAPASSVAPAAAPAPAAVAPATTPSPEDVAWDRIVQAAKKEGKVNAYSYTWVGEIGLTVERAFEARYGIDLDVITGRGAEFIERIKTEKRMGKVVADFTEGSALHVNNMREEGLLALVADDLPVLREKGVWDVHPLALDPDHRRNLVWRQSVYTPYVNTKLVPSGKEPTSFKDLLKPEWKGKMSLTEPNLSAGAYQYFVPLLDKKAIDEGYIIALSKQGLAYPAGLPEEHAMLARGEVLLNIRGTDSTAPRFIMEGAPIKAIDFKEGAVVTGASIAAVGEGPHPNAVKVLINWLLSPEGQSAAGKPQGNKMVRNDVPDFRPAAAQTKIGNPIIMTMEHNRQATELFRQRWYDDITGRRK